MVGRADAFDWRRRAAGADSVPVGKDVNVGRDYAVGWFTLALINAALAQCKSRSGLIWFFLSVLFGPLATLALVILSRPKAA
jgi:hypothetical protein